MKQEVFNSHRSELIREIAFTTGGTSPISLGRCEPGCSPAVRGLPGAPPGALRTEHAFAALGTRQGSISRRPAVPRTRVAEPAKHVSRAENQQLQPPPRRNSVPLTCLGSQMPPTEQFPGEPLAPNVRISPKLLELASVPGSSRGLRGGRAVVGAWRQQQVLPRPREPATCAETCQRTGRQCHIWDNGNNTLNSDNQRL